MLFKRRILKTTRESREPTKQNEIKRRAKRPVIVPNTYTNYDKLCEKLKKKKNRDPRETGRIRPPSSVFLRNRIIVSVIYFYFFVFLFFSPFVANQFWILIKNNNSGRRRPTTTTGSFDPISSPSVLGTIVRRGYQYPPRLGRCRNFNTPVHSADSSHFRRLYLTCYNTLSL